MRNCLILGSGRSGTSMLGGILHNTGYFMGDKLYRQGLDSNLKGFFEWKEINQINETILSSYGQSIYTGITRKFFKKNRVTNPGKNQRWLLSLPPGVNVKCSDSATAERIKQVVEKEPFCYKDPRFSYTLPVWKNFLAKDTAYICIFREPGVTVESILKECRSRDYLADLIINRRLAYKVWANIYSHILLKGAVPPQEKNFFFVHYNQIYDGSALPALAKFLNAELNSDFVEKDLKRSVSLKPDPGYVKKIYGRLCELAGYKIHGEK